MGYLEDAAAQVLVPGNADVAVLPPPTLTTRRGDIGVGGDCNRPDTPFTVPGAARLALVMAGQLYSGAIVPVRRLRAMTGRRVVVPAPSGRTHLQFRRFAGCPICHLHLCSFAHRYQEVADAGITEVVFFHSPDVELRGYQSLLPFTVVADPDWALYRDFGVETGLRAIADPRAWWSIIRGGAATLRHREDPDRVGVGSSAGTTHLRLPVDFLIDPDGTVVAAHYGRHADDQWSVDQLLDLHRMLGGKESPWAASG